MKKGNSEKVQKALALQAARKRAKQKLSYGVMAIDPATKCGIAYQDPDKEPSVELWDLSRKAHESDGMKWLRFRGKLKIFTDKHNIRVIAYEIPAGKHVGAVIHHAKLAGIIEEFCEANGMECKAYSSSSIKAIATGKGNSGKPEVIQAAKERLGYLGNDDNEADALWLLQLAKSEL